MAKALVGYISTRDTHLLREVVGLRRRVADLEAEILRLQSRNDALSTALRERELVDELGAARVLEPALR
ncbi:MAG: hypothetical protein H0U47_07060 [Nocardioidaceae bacterium]|nr:hypothetical protein [Nocardioidaceae bacterium]